MTQSVREVEDRLETIVSSGVHLESRESVLRHLESSPHLFNVVLRAIEAAREHLPGAQLTLQVYQDPEVDDAHLVLYARQTLYDSSFMERLRHAQAAFANALTNSGEWLHLTTDFRMPNA